MASSDEAKVKLSADVSSFNSAISSAKSTITELNSALRLVQTQMNTSGSSTDQLQQKLTTLQEKSKALATEEEALKGKLDATKAVYGENSTEAQKLQTQLNNVQTQEEKVTQEINKTTEALEQQQKAEEQASSASGQLASTIQQQESELAELKTQYTNVVLEEGKDSEAAQELAGKITTLNGELQENKAKLADAEDAAEDLTKEEKELGDEGESAGDKMSEGFQVAYQALAAAGLIEAVKQLVDALKECVEVAADFESQMSTVQALSGATSDEMDALTAAAKEMGATTKFTATESAEALEYMALAGWDTEEMMDGLPGIINLAAAAGEDLASTSDIVTDALTAFGMSASDSAHFSDVLAAASTNSNTTVSQMGEAFKQVATTAGTLGYSIDDVSVALGLMADNGLKGSSAGTALSTALTRMSGANATATKELDELNVSMFNADGSTKDLATFLGELRTALNENCTSSEEMQVALYNLAGQKGMKGLAAIVNTTDDDFDSLTNAIADCDGCAEEMADIRMDNFEGSVTLLKSAFDGLETTIGEAALPALSSFVDILTSMVGGINNFLVAHEGATQAVIAITVAVVAFTAAILACSVGMEALKKAINAVTTALESNPFGMALAAVTALAAGLTALVAMYRNTDTEQNNLRKDVKALTQEIDDQRDAYDELCESNEETARNYSDLADELNNLLSQTDKEASDYARISAIVDELNGYLGENVIIYDQETDSINMTAEALDNLVESQNKTTEYEAALERQSELYDDQAQLTEELARAQEDLDGVLTGVTETEGMNAFQLAAAGQAATGAAERSADYQQAVYDLQAELDATNAELDEVNEQINEYSAVTEEAAGTTEGEITVAVEDLAEKLISLQTEYDEAYESAYESISGQFDLWEQLDEVTTTTFEDAMAAMETQREYWKDYADNVEELMNRNIDGLDELVLAYCDGSMESAGYIASLAEMNDEEIEQIIFEQERLSQQQYRLADETADAYTGMSEATDAAIQECIAIIMDLDQSDEAREAAYETLAGYISGYEDEEGEVTGEVQRVKDSALEEFRNEANISEARSAGSDTGKAYPEGILEASTEVGTATSQIVQAGI
ncbi:MAG: phage tail tape measure protein, partial [Bacteroidales bacterium]|nr:phage tail tape measure protein [Bacteroidales bacterium]